MKRIAVWNTAFLGDAVLTLPLLQSLHENFPHVSIDYYVRWGFEGLFQEHPAITNVYGVRKEERKGTALIRLARQLRSHKYDAWVCAHPSFRSGMISRMSGASLRVGYFETLFSSLWFTKRVSRQFQQKEEIERVLGLLEPFEGQLISVWPEITLPDLAYKNAETVFSSMNRPVLGLHPGSVWPTKRWPSKYFAALGALALSHGADVVLFAGPGEEAIANEVKEIICNQGTPSEFKKIHNFAGKLTLVELAAYLKQLNCYVTNDSGPMHLAWAQHTPVTALFGPTVKALGFFPRGIGVSVIETDLACRPCGLHGHNVCPRGHHGCMENISPERVWDDVKEKLFRKTELFLKSYK